MTKHPPWWARTVNSLPAVRETQVWYLGREDPLKKGMATHCSILAWRIPWTEEPEGLYSPWGRKESDRTERLTLLLQVAALSVQAGSAWLCHVGPCAMPTCSWSRHLNPKAEVTQLLSSSLSHLKTGSRGLGRSCKTTHKEEKCLQSGFFQELFLECDFGDASLAFWFCTIQEIIRSQTPAQPQHHHTSEAQAGHSEFFFLWKRLNN